MTVFPSDWILAALLVVFLPAYGVWEIRELRRWIAEGLPDPRLRAYRYGMAVTWLFTIVLGMLWIATTREWALLGVRLGERWWLGVVAVVGFAVLAWVQDRAVLADEAQADKVRASFGDLRDMLPSDDRESVWWAGVSVTAGVCEELLFRGFLIALLETVTNAWVAVGASSLAFGLAHVYQGAGGVLKSGLFGLGMALLYKGTGALWAPVVVHVLIDLNSGWLGRRLFASR